ncbi:MAG TPA: glucose 1-dehydrogenase [Acidimicrobiales bacterium]
MTGRLAGQVALITGAASGIGLATAERFEAEGAVVVGLDIADEPRPECTAEFSGGYHAASVTDVDAVAAVVAEAVDANGPIDSLVQAAGVAGGGPLHFMPHDEWDRVIAVNLTGTMQVAKAVIEQSMLPNRSGSIVNIASIEGLEGFEGGSAYNASKGGVVLLTKNMAMDYGRVGIRVNCVCPGFIDTPMCEGIFGNPGMEVHKERLIEMHQLGRLGQPSEIAAAALFLCSDDASFVTGHPLVVDGGLIAGHRTGIMEMFGLT